MNFILTPEFNDLFPDQQANLKDLLKDIPSTLIIQLLAMLNAELFANDKGHPTQLKIFELLLRRQAPGLKTQILQNALIKIQGNPKDDSQFFAVLYNMHFLHHEFTNFRDFPDRELSVEEDLKVFKAYFLIVEEVNKNYKKTLAPQTQYDKDYFAKKTWPILIDQFELNQPINPYVMMVRGLMFFNYLELHSPYKIYVKDYLQKNKKATAWHYVLDIIQLIRAGVDRAQQMNPNEWASFSLSNGQGFESVFSKFAIDKDVYAEKFGAGKSNYSGFKSKPLYRVDDNTYVILSWPFLAGKMYEGLLFDFYQHSGIDQEFTTFTAFKQYVGECITEQYVSRKLLKAIFNKKHDVLLFDVQGIQGFPDAYHRRNNDLILFEIKDTYFPASAISSFSYEEITAAIDLKVNNPKKGTGQIIKQLKSLTKSSFEQPQKYKHVSNITVYPVIIYADLLFEMPGIDQYLTEAFRKAIERENLNPHFKTIKPLTIVNLSFLVRNFDLLEKSKTKFTGLIDHYHKYLKTKHKHAKRTRTLKSHVAAYQTFGQVIKPLLNADSPSRDYVAASNQAFDLTAGLPVNNDN